MANENVVLEIDPSNITTVQDEPKKRNFVWDFLRTLLNVKVT